MRYFAIFLIIAGMFTVMFMLKGSESDHPEEISSIPQRAQFDTDSLVGSWSGQGLLHFPGGEEAMTLSGEFTVVFDSVTKQYRTETKISGHEFAYSDSGFVSMLGDSVTWDLWDNENRQMSYRGILADETVLVIYNTPDYEYRQTLYFLSGSALYIKTELYKEEELQNWLELTCRRM